jgi:hypothetical protein
MKMRVLLPALLCAVQALSAAPFQEATITRVVNQVDLLPPARQPQKASVGSEVRGQTAVRTGADSRTELRFPDHTITRLGANALFRFDTGTRRMELEQGTILFSPAKGSGGGEVQMGAVTAAVAGTTFLGSHLPKQEIKVIVLEGKVRVFWKGFFLGSRVLKPGEIFQLPLTSPSARATVSRLELKKLLATSRLLESGGFGPLPSQPQILSAAGSQKLPPLVKITNPQADGPLTAQTARRTEDVTQPRPPAPPPASRPPAPPPPPPAPPKPPGPTPTPPPPPLILGD